MKVFYKILSMILLAPGVVIFTHMIFNFHGFFQGTIIERSDRPEYLGTIFYFFASIVILFSASLPEFFLRKKNDIQDSREKVITYVIIFLYIIIVTMCYLPYKTLQSYGMNPEWFFYLFIALLFAFNLNYLIKPKAETP